MMQKGGILSTIWDMRVQEGKKCQDEANKNDVTGVYGTQETVPPQGLSQRHMDGG